MCTVKYRNMEKYTDGASLSEKHFYRTYQKKGTPRDKIDMSEIWEITTTRLSKVNVKSYTHACTL